MRTYISQNQITDEGIAARLKATTNVSVEWTGYMPRDSEDYADAANEQFYGLTVDDVRTAIANTVICADSVEKMIDVGISIASEPEGLPENAAVAVQYVDLRHV